MIEKSTTEGREVIGGEGKKICYQRVLLYLVSVYGSFQLLDSTLLHVLFTENLIFNPCSMHVHQLRQSLHLSIRVEAKVVSQDLHYQYDAISESSSKIFFTHWRRSFLIVLVILVAHGTSRMWRRQHPLIGFAIINKKFNVTIAISSVSIGVSLFAHEPKCFFTSDYVVIVIVIVYSFSIFSQHLSYNVGLISLHSFISETLSYSFPISISLCVIRYPIVSFLSFMNVCRHPFWMHLLFRSMLVIIVIIRTLIRRRRSIIRTRCIRNPTISFRRRSAPSYPFIKIAGSSSIKAEVNVIPSMVFNGVLITSITIWWHVLVKII